MDERIFRDRLRHIYAAHGKAPASDLVIQAVWMRVRDLPDAFMEWATIELADSEKLPANLGYELARNLWPRFKHEQRGQLVQEFRTCRDCRGEGALEGSGFIAFIPDARGIWHSTFAPCQCYHDQKAPRYTKAQIKSQGGAVMPEGGFPGGEIAFRQQVLGENHGSGNAALLMQAIGKWDSKREYERRMEQDKYREEFPEYAVGGMQ